MPPSSSLLRLCKLVLDHLIERVPVLVQEMRHPRLLLLAGLKSLNFERDDQLRAELLNSSKNVSVGKRK
jgi:hypothetical protein